MVGLTGVKPHGSLVAGANQPLGPWGRCARRERGRGIKCHETNTQVKPLSFGMDVGVRQVRLPSHTARLALNGLNKCKHLQGACAFGKF